MRQGARPRGWFWGTSVAFIVTALLAGVFTVFAVHKAIETLSSIHSRRYGVAHLQTGDSRSLVGQFHVRVPICVSIGLTGAARQHPSKELCWSSIFRLPSLECFSCHARLYDMGIHVSNVLLLSSHSLPISITLLLGSLAVSAHSSTLPLPPNASRNASLCIYLVARTFKVFSIHLPHHLSIPPSPSALVSTCDVSILGEPRNDMQHPHLFSRV